MNEDEALKNLKLRYSNGEITRKEYLQMKKDLSEEYEGEEEDDYEEEEPRRRVKRKSGSGGKVVAIIIILVIIIGVFWFLNNYRSLSQPSGSSAPAAVADVVVVNCVGSAQVNGLSYDMVGDVQFINNGGAAGSACTNVQVLNQGSVITSQTVCSDTIAPGQAQQKPFSIGVAMAGQNSYSVQCT